LMSSTFDFEVVGRMTEGPPAVMILLFEACC
jgi:hypothetical protein